MQMRLRRASERAQRAGVARGSREAGALSNVMIFSSWHEPQAALKCSHCSDSVTRYWPVAVRVRAAKSGTRILLCAPAVRVHQLAADLGVEAVAQIVDDRCHVEVAAARARRRCSARSGERARVPGLSSPAPHLAARRAAAAGVPARGGAVRCRPPARSLLCFVSLGLCGAHS